ncbi:hypothetical protein H0H93_004040 [Arthromyces matolae]|nr:hypothetical protein H0H93_004040 [Arthromyces matolae]
MSWRRVFFSEVNEFANECWSFGDETDETNIDLGAFGEIFPLHFSGDQKILVRDCYRTLYKQTWDYGLYKPRSAVVVTGQPGIGASCPIPCVANSPNSPQAKHITYSIYSLKLHQDYPAFEIALKNLLLGHSDEDQFPSEALKAAEEALRRHIDNTLEQGDSRAAWPSSSTAPLTQPDSVTLPATNSATANPNPLAISLDDALRILIDDAVQIHGPIPREVFLAILQARDEQQDNKLANLDLTALEAIVTQAQGANLAVIEGSQSVIRVEPRANGPFKTCSWEPSFKSEWVAKKAFRQMQNLSLSDLRRHFLLRNSVSNTVTFAGQLFEMTSHRLICRGEHDYHYYQLKSNEHSPPKFSSAIYSGEASGALSKRTKRQLIWFTRQTLRQQLKDSAVGDYFVPEHTNYPFFDAFFYEKDDGKITLYILQMTSVKDHRGSSQGYATIRDIIHFLRTNQHLYREEAPPSKRARLAVDVTVKYMLVCPFEKGRPCSSSQDPSWQMPKGWFDDDQQIDVRGPAFLLAIPMDKD